MSELREERYAVAAGIRAVGLRVVMFEQGRTALAPTAPLRRALNPNGDTVTYRGSFICLWASSSPGLITDPTKQIVSGNYWWTSAIGNWQYLPFQSGAGYYAPPVRDWGFDTRFKSLANMPPGAPFLTSGIYSNWTEAGR